MELTNRKSMIMNEREKQANIRSNKGVKSVRSNYKGRKKNKKKNRSATNYIAVIRETNIIKLFF